MSALNNIMKNIDLLFDNENLLELKSLILNAKQQSKGTEFEVRFQNISQFQFEQVKNYIDLDKYFNNKKDTQSISELLPNDIRIEKFNMSFLSFNKKNHKIFNKYYFEHMFVS
jgi:hypothetical protein